MKKPRLTRRIEPATAKPVAWAEPLEERRLLSASAFASLSRGGTLTVAGTGHSDVMYVTRERRHPGMLDAVVNGQVMSFAAFRVKNVVLLGGLGNDDIIVDDSHGVVPGTHQLFGGDGNDTLAGDAGDDSLFGQAGDDSLLGGAGNDSLDGGDGNDDLDGGSGSDHVRGGNGTDHFHGSDDSASEIQDESSEDVNDDNGGGGGGHATTHQSVLRPSDDATKGLFA